MTKIDDLSHAEKLLDAGKLEMQRPWGDWVPIRRRGVSIRSYGKLNGIPVFMERQVEAVITKGTAALGFPGLRVAS